MSNTMKWYLNSGISLGIMIGFRFIPNPEPMTPLGMTVVGIFLGAVYGWCTTNMIWPSLCALILYGLTGQIQVSAAWGALWSNMTVGICFWLMICVGLLKNTGLIEYIANWSVTRKFTKGKPWTLVIIIYLAALVCASCLSEVAVTLVFWSLIWTICQEAGYEKGNKTATWLTFSIAILVGTGGFLLPFKMAVFSNFGFLAAGSNGAYDGRFDYGAWTCFTLTVVVTMLVVWLLLSKFVLKIDLSKLAAYTPDVSNVQKLTRKQILSLTLFGILFFILMAPSFLPKTFFLTIWLNKLGTVGGAMLIIMITCWIRIDGEPLLKFEDLVHYNVIWNVILMMGTALMLCACMNGEAAGVGAWLQVVLNPIFTNMGPMTFLICYFLIASIVTNLVNNAVVGAIMIPISFSISVAMGLNPVAVCACMILFADFGIFLPSASPTGALVHNTGGWIPKGDLYKYAFLGVALFVLSSLFVGWPLANILFPFDI